MKNSWPLFWSVTVICITVIICMGYGAFLAQAGVAILLFAFLIFVVRSM